MRAKSNNSYGDEGDNPLPTNARHRPARQARPAKRHPGFTLVEVIAGVALLGTLLAGLMLGFSKHVRQYQAARLRIQAIDKLDRQLELWYANGDELPIDSEGPLSAQPPLTWHTTTVRSPQAQRLNAVIVRVEVRRSDRADSSPPVIAVELLHPAIAASNPTTSHE